MDNGILAGNLGEPAARSGISPAASQRTQEAISAMGFDPDFFANVNAVEVPEFNVSINEDIQKILQEQLNQSNYPVSECDELHPYIWLQHLANQCPWRVHYLSLEQSKLNFSSTLKGICTIIGKNRSRLKYIVEGI